ncbi:endo-1-4-beta-xylanase 2 [Penicillium hordei]|uniref:Endo-1,4-beta-xylanase n=1 Tax=Penicillium hordei TaxID=40994 RepID=A0AAD6DM44_9EURO|nr:endo-1-4-beta-xylanase 2 [Penicillium hordei]KAJ5588938.1 endo-1-4-beta-xylanase 2 [Penicillium hordei]
MFSFSTLMLAACACVSTFAAPTDSYLAERALTTSQTGENNGYHYSFWTNGGGQVQYNNGKNGEYDVSWKDCGDFTSGKGWSTGTNRDIHFAGNFNPSGNAYLAVYGWTKGPLVEYYVLENYGEYNPGSSMTHKGSFSSDGSVYDIYTHQQVNQPSIEGTTTFMQYWSIRRNKRSAGTVTTANHFNAWASHGMNLGQHDYQILSVEGFASSGSARMSVW